MNDTQCPVDRAIVLSQDGRLEEALGTLEAAIREGHDPARAWYQRGLALVALQRKDEAMAAYQQAIELRPEYLKALVNLAGLYMERENVPAAAELIDRAEALADEHDAIFLIHRAKIRRATGNVKGAIADAAHATESAPEIAALWTELGLALLMDPRGNEHSMEASRRALELDPHDAHAAHNLAVALDRSGDVEEAFGHVSVALAAQPENATFQQTAACVLLHRGEPEAALPLLRAVARVRPESFEAHYNLACGLAQTGGGDDAVEHVRRALALVPPGHRDGFRGHVPRDPDLAALHEIAAFRELLVEQGIG